MRGRAQISAIRTAFVAAIGGGLLAAFGTSSCASVPDSQRFTAVLQPDYQIYKVNVDQYLANRCGTLDCHGQPGRAYRIYSRQGFRDYTENDGGLVSGQQPTTEGEIRANFDAIVALEPEEMSRLVASQGSDEELNRILFLRKPLKIERHKGGQVMAEDDPGYKCVTEWLRVPVVDADGNPIPEASRALSAKGVAACAAAAALP